MRRYPKFIKDEAIRLYFDDHLSQKEIADKLGVSDWTRIKRWVRNYRRTSKPYSESKKIGRPRLDPDKPPKPKKVRRRDLETELQQLRMENELLKKFHSELRRWSREK